MKEHITTLYSLILPFGVLYLENDVLSSSLLNDHTNILLTLKHVG